MNLIMVEIAKWFAIFFLVFFLFFFVILRIIRHYYHFPIPSFLTKLIDNPIRRKLIQNPTTIAKRMQLQAGMTVVEIGPGKGNYTMAIAKKILPNGKVIAIDIQESVIKDLKKKLKEEKIPNIEPRIDNAHNLSIPSESIDRVIAISCLPEIPKPIQVLCEFKRILKPNGLVCLCELVFDPDYPRRKTEQKWAREAGLKLGNEFGNFFSYQLNFKKT